MKYKRLEIYLGWKCNHKCIFCIEMEKITKYFTYEISESEVLGILIKMRKKWYNHVTFLWWEPTIQKNFLFSLRIAKKLWYTILVTTNGSIIAVESKAKEFLPYINQLIISIPAIEDSLQLEINGTKSIIDFSRVFRNIEQYWQWDFLKINVVFNKYNHLRYQEIIDFSVTYKNLVTEISFTYPELNADFYWEDYLKNNLLVAYKEIPYQEIINYAAQKNIKIRIVDVPFCLLGEKNRIYSDDIDYDPRKKINNEGIEKQWWELEFRPRERYHIIKCRWCKYINQCWGPGKVYVQLFWDDEIQPIQ